MLNLYLSITSTIFNIKNLLILTVVNLGFCIKISFNDILHVHIFKLTISHVHNYFLGNLALNKCIIMMPTKVGEIAKKVQERRLKWHGHVMRREEHYVGRRAMEMKVQGRRKRGRPKRRWLDRVRDDIKEKGLSAEEVYDRDTRRRTSSYIDHT